MTKPTIDASDPRLYSGVYIPFLNDQRQTQLFFGGSSSGKSTFVIGQRTVLDLLEGGRNFLICRNVGRTNRDSTFNELQKGFERMGLTSLFSVNKTDMTITCANGYQAIFKGLDDIEKVKSVTPRRGALTDIIVEEATETQRDKVKQLRKRMRGQGEKSKRMTLLFNPVYKTHWIYADYFAGKWDDSKTYLSDDRAFILKTTYQDNDFLGEDEVYDLENETDAYFKDVYTYGNWGVLGAVLFSNWSTQDLSGYTFDRYRNGLDFGYAADPCALSRSTRRGNQILLTDEMYKKALTNTMIHAEINPIIGREIVKCDSAEPKSIHELKALGTRAVPCKKGADSVLHGIRWLQGMEIIVHSELQNMINELTIGQWKKDKNGDVIPVPVDRDNHLIDALRYSYDDEMNVKTKIRGGVMPF